MFVSSTVLMWMSGCGVTTDHAPLETVLELSVRYAGESDVYGLILRHGPTDCAAADRPSRVHELVLDLVNDRVLGAGLARHEQVVDLESRTLIWKGDLEVVPGCHWVQVVPVAADGLSQSCEGIQVVSPPVELDSRAAAAVTLACTHVIGSPDPFPGNTPPNVRSVDVPEDPVGQCEPVSICVEVEDLDDDSLLVDWGWVDPEGTMELVEPTMEVVDFAHGHREWLACTRVAGRVPGSHLVRVVVWDLVSGVRGLSRDEAWIRLQVDWLAEPSCMDPDGRVVDDASQVRELALGCEPTAAEDWWCSGAHDVDPKRVSELCEGPDLVEAALYPVCPP